jgi:hypothetical protein
LSPGGERRIRTSAHRPADSPAQRGDIRLRRGRGRFRSDARHPGRRHRPRRAGRNPTAGQTVRGCPRSRHGRQHRDCHRRGKSSHRRRCRYRDRMSRRSPGSSSGACRRRRRRGRATVRRHTRHRSRRGCPRSRHESQAGPHRTRRGRRRRPIREIRRSHGRRRNQRDSNTRRSNRRTGRSRPTPLDAPGAPNRPSYGPRHHSGVRRRSGAHARHRRRRAPARCRPQPLKPPPEHISLHPTRPKDSPRPATAPRVSCCYPSDYGADKSSWKICTPLACKSSIKKNLPRSFAPRLGATETEMSTRFMRQNSQATPGPGPKTRPTAMIAKTYFLAKDPHRTDAQILRHDGSANGDAGSGIRPPPGEGRVGRSGKLSAGLPKERRRKFALAVLPDVQACL